MSRTWAGVRSWNSSTSRCRQLRLEPPPELAVSQERLDGAVDLVVEVDRTSLGQVGAVGAEQLGQAVDVVPGRFDVGRVGEAQADRAEGLEVGADRVGVGAPLALAGQQRFHEPTALALLEHPGHGPAVLGEDPEAERVEGADPGTEGRGAPLQLELGLLVVGHGQHALALPRPVSQQVAEPFGEDPGLARARRRDHPGRAAEVGRPPPAGPARGLPPVHGGASEAESTDSAWTTGCPATSAGEGPTGAAVDPHRPCRRPARRRPRPAGWAWRRGGRPCGPTTRSARRCDRRRCWPRPGSGAGPTRARSRATGATGRR